jgi:hypothetical protein
MPGIPFSAPLPPDAPAPPAGLGGGVRWPDGVYRPPGERPEGGVQHKGQPMVDQRDEPHPLTQPNRARAARRAAIALSAAALAALAALAIIRRRSRR